MSGKIVLAIKSKIGSEAELTAEQLHEIFEYRDGDLYWKPSKAGAIAGGGYYQTGIQGKYFKNHRLIFLMHHGYLPDLIDHIDGNRLNNKIENLRPATRSQNLFNSMKSKSNKSGVKGVSWRESMKKYRARLYANKKTYELGHFEKLEDAEKAIIEARKKHHGEFANKG
jgi:hypothetical protein